MKKKIITVGLIILGVLSIVGAGIAQWSEEVPLVPANRTLIKVDEYPVRVDADFPREPSLMNWHVTGKYLINKTAFDADTSLLRDFGRLEDGFLLWELWANSREWFGKLSTPAFKAPIIMSMMVAGFPHLEGNQLYLERLDTRERLMLEVLPPPLASWVNVKWLLPPSWRGTSVHMVVVGGALKPDHAHSRWIGISVPMEPNGWELLKFQFRPILFFLLYLLHFCLLFIPGIFLAIVLIQKYSLHDSLTLGLSLTIISFTGYGMFWIHLFHHHVGQAFSFALIIGGVGSIWYMTRYRRAAISKMFSEEVLVPIVLMFFVGCFYLALLYTGGDASVAEILPRIRFTHALPTDNILQKILADKLYTGVDLNPFYGDWKSSDRPPLQAGMILTQRPLMKLLTVGEHYQILALILQCSWVPAIWAFCRCLGIFKQTIALIIGFAGFSGFFLINSVYVWPKLFGGALIVFALSLILPKMIRREKPSKVEMIIFATTATMGMLAHGGVIFTLLAVFLILGTPRYFPGIQQSLIGIGCFLILSSTWMAYQQFYDPPGNTLLKLHLAGSSVIDDRSLIEAMREAYGKISLAQWLDLKWENLKSLVETGPLTEGVPEEMSLADWLRSPLFINWHRNQFFHIISTLGLLNIGWLVFLAMLLPQIRSSTEVGMILKICFISFFLWIMAIFGPPVTNIVIHHGSYANIILLFVALTLLIARLPSWIVVALLTCHLGIFTLLWIGGTPERYESIHTLINLPNFPMIAFATISGIVLLALLHKTSRSS